MTTKIKKDYKGLKNLYKELPKLNKKVVQYGYFDGASHKPSGERGDSITLASLMLMHEEGNGDFPPRPVFGGTGYQLMQTLPKDIRYLVSEYLVNLSKGKITDTELLTLIGDIMRESTEDNFGIGSSLNLKDNSSRTIKKKGRNDPLVDEGYLRDNIKVRVK